MLLAIVCGFIITESDLKVSVFCVYHFVGMELCIKRHSAFQNSINRYLIAADRLSKPTDKIIAFSYRSRQLSGRLVVSGQSQRCHVRCTKIRLRIKDDRFFGRTQRYRCRFIRQFRIQCLAELHILLAVQRQSIFGHDHTGEHFAFTVQNIRSDRTEIRILQGVVGNVRIDRVAVVITLDQRRVHRYQALVLRQQTVDSYICAIVHGVQLVRILDPGACIEVNALIRHLRFCADQIGYIHGLNIGINVLVDLLIC